MSLASAKDEYVVTTAPDAREAALIVMQYQQKFIGAVSACREVEKLLGATVFERALQLSAQVVLADITGAARPGGMLLTMLPAKFASYVDMASDFAKIGLESGLVEISWIEEIASSEEKARSVIQSLRGILK